MTYMPRFKLPAAESNYAGHTQAESALLRRRSMAGLNELIASRDSNKSKSLYTERLEAELSIIEQKAVSAYFLIVADYVHWAKENGISVGPGRGAGPCSLVGYALGITAIDPLTYELPFERFLNPDRQTIPDFDIDFCSSRYTEVVNYLRTTYGNENVAQISSDNGIPMPSRLIVCDRPLRDLAPVFIDPSSGMCSLQLNRAQALDAGFVQFNVIKQPALTMIRSQLQRLAERGDPVDPNTIRLDDGSTYDLLSSDQSTHLEPLDHHYEATLLSVQPDRFEELYAVVALSYSWMQVRLREYVQRQQNPESIESIHPVVDNIVAETYGLILYQEQIMQIAHKMGGLTYAQTDTFRRLAKSNRMQGVAPYKAQFLDGAISRGMTKSDAADLFEEMVASCRCSFTKAHAIAFALIAYQEAWLRADHQ